MDKKQLKSFVDRFEGFYSFSYLNKIILFGYYVEHVIKKGQFTSKDIRECFQTLALRLPANLPFMMKFLIGKKKKFVKYGKTIQVIGSEADKIQKSLEGETTFKENSIGNEFPKELGIHEKISEVSKDLYFDRYYSPSIFEAVKVLEQEIKKKSGIKNLLGVKLVNKVFNPKKPVLKIVKGNDIEHIDEREGFRLILMGVFLGIKNPKSHSIQELKDPEKALEYLAMLSLMLKRVDESIK